MSFSASGGQPPGSQPPSQQQAPPPAPPQVQTAPGAAPVQQPVTTQAQAPVSAPVSSAAVGTIGQPNVTVSQQPQQSVTPQSGGDPMPPTMPVYPPGSEVIQAGEGFPLSMSGGGGGAGANTLISPTPFQPQQPQGERFPTAGQPRPGNKVKVRISL